MRTPSWKLLVGTLTAAALLATLGCSSKTPQQPAAGPKAPEARALAVSPPADANQAKVELGKLLFFDTRLSGDRALSCATCHVPSKAWTDGEALSAGYPGTKYFRNTPTLLNAAVNYQKLNWDGRFTSSDMDSLVRDFVTESHWLMADGRLVIERLRQVPEYEAFFQAAYGGEPTLGRFLGAVSAFVRTLKTGDNALDKFLKGDNTALGPEARAGYDLFKGKAGCAQCHSGTNLTDGKFHNLGVPANPEILNDPLRLITLRKFLRTHGVPNYANTADDPGLFVITQENEDRGKFRTPSLREVAKTAPYMHNGALKTLDDVVEFYNQGGGGAPGQSGLLRPLGLTTEEKKNLVAFLNALSGKEPEIKPPPALQYQLRELGKN